MKNKILKWWNREWSNWEHSGYVTTRNKDWTPRMKEEILVSTSNDGLKRYKRVKIY